MANSFFRANIPTEPKQIHAPRLVAALILVPIFSACVSYEAAPVDLPQTLLELEEQQWLSPANADSAEAQPGAGPAQLASFAVTHHPSLRVARARIGVAEALLIEAGLLSDPAIGWDGMDMFASEIIDGSSSSIDILSGFGFSIPLPRPGELDAKEGAARWRVEETRRRVTAAEWVLAREVYVSYEDVLEAERLLAQNNDAMQVAETTRQYFERAKAAGAATAIQANLAVGDFLAIRAQRVRLESRLRVVRHRLNALLGLPPTAIVAVAVDSTMKETASDALELNPELLVERSLTLRPDLLVLLASYESAEEELRLEVARQLPQIALGTGIELIPGLFTRFNRRAIDTAKARREALRVEVEAEVHELRREIHDAFAALEESRRELSFLESELLPNAEESLRLAGEAFDVGEVTLLEILTLQRVLVDARTRTTEARAELQRRHWRLLSASGTLLATAATEALQVDNPNAPVR